METPMYFGNVKVDRASLARQDRFLELADKANALPAHKYSIGDVEEKVSVACRIALIHDKYQEGATKLLSVQRETDKLSKDLQKWRDGLTVHQEALTQQVSLNSRISAFFGGNQEKHSQAIKESKGSVFWNQQYVDNLVDTINSQTKFEKGLKNVLFEMAEQVRGILFTDDQLDQFEKEIADFKSHLKAEKKHSKNRLQRFLNLGFRASVLPKVEYSLGDVRSKYEFASTLNVQKEKYSKLKQKFDATEKETRIESKNIKKLLSELDKQKSKLEKASAFSKRAEKFIEGKANLHSKAIEAEKRSEAYLQACLDQANETIEALFEMKNSIQDEMMRLEKAFKGVGFTKKQLDQFEKEISIVEESQNGMGEVWSDRDDFEMYKKDFPREYELRKNSILFTGLNHKFEEKFHIGVGDLSSRLKRYEELQERVESLGPDYDFDLGDLCGIEEYYEELTKLNDRYLKLHDNISGMMAYNVSEFHKADKSIREVDLEIEELKKVLCSFAVLLMLIGYYLSLGFAFKEKIETRIHAKDNILRLKDTQYSIRTTKELAFNGFHQRMDELRESMMIEREVKGLGLDQITSEALDALEMQVEAAENIADQKVIYFTKDQLEEAKRDYPEVLKVIMPKVRVKN